MTKTTKNQKRGAFYWIDSKAYVSVTEVLRILDKPGLRYWFGKQVYLAMLANPSLSEPEALSSPYKVSDKAKERGSTVHSIVEAFKNTGETIKDIPDQFKGYADAFYRWTRDNHISIIEHERMVISREYTYAGTLDLLVKVNNNDKPLIIDVKTGKDIYPEAFLQLSAYRRALKEDGQETDGIAVLLLQEDGSYKYSLASDDYLDEFLAAKKLWEWQNGETVAQLKSYSKGGQDATRETIG